MNAVCRGQWDRLSPSAARGLPVTPQAEAVARADVAVMAVPDALIGRIARTLVTQSEKRGHDNRPRSAAAYAGELPERSDITTLPSIHAIRLSSAMRQTRALHDYFGGIRAKQNIVCGTGPGTGVRLRAGVDIARRMFAPVINAYSCESRARWHLEPALSETTAATCIVIMREAMERRSAAECPPTQRKRSCLGHINIALAIVFGKVGNPFSDGALRAIARAKTQIFQRTGRKCLSPKLFGRAFAGIVHPD